MIEFLTGEAGQEAEIVNLLSFMHTSDAEKKKIPDIKLVYKDTLEPSAPTASTLSLNLAPCQLSLDPGLVDRTYLLFHYRYNFASWVMMHLLSITEFMLFFTPVKWTLNVFVLLLHLHHRPLPSLSQSLAPLRPYPSSCPSLICASIGITSVHSSVVPSIQKLPSSSSRTWA